VKNPLEKLIVVGDRVLVKPSTPTERTQTGLFLPPGVQEKERVQSGYILKVGPGYPIPLPVEENEPWKEKDEKIKYLPLQAKEGDMAIYLQSGSFEITYENEKYVIVPQQSILLLVRDEDLFR
jgi:chaperonin GroES